jgi:hypothetical protein
MTVRRSLSLAGPNRLPIYSLGQMPLVVVYDQLVEGLKSSMG